MTKVTHGLDHRLVGRKRKEKRTQERERGRRKRADMTSFDSFKHAVHTVFKETVEAVTPISNVSQFREKGVLTPEEFVAAGGQLSPSLSNAYQPCQTYPCAFIAVILRRSICGVLWGSPFPGGRWYGVVVLNERQGGSCNSQLQHAIDEPALIRRRLVVRKVPLVVVAGRRTGQGGCQLPPFDRPLFAEKSRSNPVAASGLVCVSTISSLLKIQCLPPPGKGIPSKGQAVSSHP